MCHDCGEKNHNRWRTVLSNDKPSQIPHMFTWKKKETYGRDMYSGIITAPASIQTLYACHSALCRNVGGSMSHICLTKCHVSEKFVFFFSGTLKSTDLRLWEHCMVYKTTEYVTSRKEEKLRFSTNFVNDLKVMFLEKFANERFTCTSFDLEEKMHSAPSTLK